MANYHDVLALADRYDRAVDKLERSQIDQLNAVIDRSYRQLEKELTKTYPELQTDGAIASFALKLDKYRQLRDLLGHLLPEGRQSEIEEMFQKTLQETVGVAINSSDDILKMIAPDNFPLEEFSGIPIEAVAAQAQEGTRRLYRYNTEFQTKANAVIEQGLIRGWGSKRVQALLRAEVGVTKSKAETIVRTEVMSSYNSAAKTRYKGVVRYGTWLSVPSEALCTFCAAKNGNTFRLDRMIIPAHPRCRCTILPSDPEWRDMGLTDEEFLEEYHQQGLDALKERGLKPNYGLTPFEKAAKLKSPPKPAWGPSKRKPKTKPAPKPTVTVVKPEPPKPKTRSTPKKPQEPTLPPMFSGHVVTINERITPESIDNAWAEIKTEGSRQRVARIKSLINKMGVNGLFTDENIRQDKDLVRKHAENAFKKLSAPFQFQTWKQNEPSIDMILPGESSRGYCFKHPAYQYVQVNVTYPTIGNPLRAFKVNADSLNSVVSRAISGDRFYSASSVALAGETGSTDTQAFVTYLHELGHKVHFWAGTTPKAFGTKSVTRYSQVSDKEYVAEHFALWVLDEKTFREFDPKGADFIEDVIKKAEELGVPTL